jgi:hypothetical protein
VATKTRTPAGAKYRAHIGSLCEQHRIRHVVEDTAPAGADLQLRGIRTPPVTGRARYLTALHEVGHVVTYDPKDGRIHMEEKAWRWAVEKAVEPPSEAGLRSIFRRLCSYVVAARLHAIETGESLDADVPRPDDPFWEFLGSLVPDSGRAAYEATKASAARRAAT